MEKQLEELGLSRNEARIYLFLLRKGETSTGPIIKETGIANSRVYESLNSLIEKGLVSFNIQRKCKYFKANEPKALLEREKGKLDKIESIMPKLTEIMSLKQKETDMAIYD